MRATEHSTQVPEAWSSHEQPTPDRGLIDEVQSELSKLIGDDRAEFLVFHSQECYIGGLHRRSVCL
jgi:hypothetical protein